nr:unnamed protein product [Digitaria exilis]
MEPHEDEDLTRLLPSDALAEALRRLPRRGLAVARCVCKSWRSVVDAHRLTLPRLLPHSLGGIFFRFGGHYTLQLLAAARRPADDPEVPADLAYLPPNRDGPYGSGSGYPYGGSFDHCNGLLLLGDAVVNPATGKWAALPPPPPPVTRSEEDFYRDKYLVFDPAVSMHFEVVAIDRLLWDSADDPAIQASECPPSPCTMLVFSSMTWQWEERNFIREGEAAGTVADMRCICPLVGKGYSAFWEGELYDIFI